MPTYEYKCESCGHVFEKTGKMSDPRETACPECGRTAEKRPTACAGVISKGGSSRLDCGRDAPCCGRSTRCDRPPCGDR